MFVEAMDGLANYYSPTKLIDSCFSKFGENNMSDHVYKKTEIVGSSKSSIEDAIEKAIERASSTLKHVDWFEVIDTRGHVVKGKVAHYQVTLKVGFRLDDS